MLRDQQFDLYIAERMKSNPLSGNNYAAQKDAWDAAWALRHAGLDELLTYLLEKRPAIWNYETIRKLASEVRSARQAAPLLEGDSPTRR